MVLYRLDVLKRGTGAEVGTTPYYWTNTYHAELSGLAVAQVVARDIALLEMTWTLEGITVVALRISVPPAPVVAGVVIPVAYPGQLMSATGPLLLRWAIRVDLVSGGKVVGHRMYRNGGGDALHEGELWTADYRDDYVLPIARFIFGPDLGVRTPAGVPYDDVLVVPEVRHWQLRHGTKRQARTYFA